MRVFLDQAILCFFQSNVKQKIIKQICNIPIYVIYDSLAYYL